MVSVMRATSTPFVFAASLAFTLFFLRVDLGTNKKSHQGNSSQQATLQISQLIYLYRLIGKNGRRLLATFRELRVFVSGSRELVATLKISLRTGYAQNFHA
jgi:hypothetical protein